MLNSNLPPVDFYHDPSRISAVEKLLPDLYLVRDQNDTESPEQDGKSSGLQSNTLNIKRLPNPRLDSFPNFEQLQPFNC